MVFENGLMNIQAEAYNGAHTVCKRKEFKLFQPFNNFWYFTQNNMTGGLETVKCIIIAKNDISIYFSLFFFSNMYLLGKKLIEKLKLRQI